VLGIP